MTQRNSEQGTLVRPTTEVVPVDTGSRSYDVLVGYEILKDIGPLVRDCVGGGAAAIISDSNVAPLYAGQVSASLAAAGYGTETLTFTAGEQNKRFSTLEILLEDLAEAGLSRDDVVIALGGGVTGDMAGLAAALYLRGIQVVQVPTSLLAMVDSSVGGKTAVDLSVGKNLAGAFFQPSIVVADIACLHTLSPELFRDSCGEIIKHGVLADVELFERLSSRPLTGEGITDADLVRVVARNVAIKRDTVNADETEKGIRQTLNLGHTLGHAIEAASDYELGHGSAVAAGLCCVARATERLGWTHEGVSGRIEDAVRAHGLPTDTGIDHKTLLAFATHDKKRHGSGVNLIVPVEIGHCVIRHVSLEELEQIIRLGCGVTQGQG